MNLIFYIKYNNIEISSIESMNSNPANYFLQMIITSKDLNF